MEQARQALLAAELRLASLRKVLERRRAELDAAAAAPGTETDRRARRAARRPRTGRHAGSGALTMEKARISSPAPQATHEARGARAAAGKAGAAQAHDQTDAQTAGFALLLAALDGGEGAGVLTTDPGRWR
ncbi:flagellar hook-length control protein [Alicycliphilus sp. B1]|nr:flagellar hook-length control protein [Alicycliphilus sp. B1]